MALAAVVGCVSYPDCAFSCDPASPACPAGYECREDGVCHRVGGGACDELPPRDGAVPDQSGSDAGGDASPSDVGLDAAADAPPSDADAATEDGGAMDGPGDDATQTDAGGDAADGPPPDGGTTVSLNANWSAEMTATQWWPNDGSDYVGSSDGSENRVAQRWSVTSVPASATVTKVEARVYVLDISGFPGELRFNRYGSSHGENNPAADGAAVAFPRCEGQTYANLSEVSVVGWTAWQELGSVAAADLTWVRAQGYQTYALGLTAGTISPSSYYSLDEYASAHPPQLRVTYATGLREPLSPSAVGPAYGPRSALDLGPERDGRGRR
jgi:hypothetical protein